MPEGPEIILFSEYLKNFILDTEIINIISISKKKVILPQKAKIIDIDTKGKLLWLRTKNYYIHIILKISGWISKDNLGNPKYIIVFNEGKKIFIDDLRKLCIVEVVSYKEHNYIIQKLGIDIYSIDFNLKNFYNAIKSYNVNICSFLMNQHIFCGIGNYIKNECLYLAKINPKRKSSNLNDKNITDLYHSIKFVYYSNLIEQLYDYDIEINHDILIFSPKNLEIPYNFKVYKKEYDPNGYKVREEIIAGRKTYFIPEIQV